jgi:hypothetical protein
MKNEKLTKENLVLPISSLIKKSIELPGYILLFPWLLSSSSPANSTLSQANDKIIFTLSS